MNDTSQKIIEVDNLVKHYGPHQAVAGLSFSVQAGESLGLLGPNGAGKTTTMRLLMGLARPTQGTIKIFGKELHSHLKEIHGCLGVVFEKPNLVENLSGYQNLALFCRLYQRPLSLIQPLLEEMELGERAHEPVKVYSKGMRQRILILRALIHTPRLLFLDEPCSGLDPLSSRMIRDHLLKLKASGITILLTSHNMEEVDELCDQIGFINRGRLIALAPTHTLKEKYGRPLLKMAYREGESLREEMVEPTAPNLLRIERLYREKRIISVHSQEATLAEIFRKLSTTAEPHASHFFPPEREETQSG